MCRHSPHRYKRHGDPNSHQTCVDTAHTGTRDMVIQTQTRMWADAQRDGCPAKYRWRLSESSVMPFVVPHRKVWPMPAAGVPFSNAANIGERKTWTQSEFCTLQNSARGKSPQKCIHSVSAQETAKRCAKSGSPPLSDVAAVMKPTCETCSGAQAGKPISAANDPKFTIL